MVTALDSAYGSYRHISFVSRKVDMNPIVPVHRGRREQKQTGESAPALNRAVRRKVAQPLDAINHPGAHLRIDVVLSLAGISRSAWYRLVESGHAPKPLRFGPRCSRWVAADISRFLADRLEQGTR